MRTLATRDVVTPLALTLHDEGTYRHLRIGGVYLCGEDPDAFYRGCMWAFAAGLTPTTRVAWIGGGMCVGPRVFALSGCIQTVYEIEPEMVEFCPCGVTFVPGDWRDTISGKYDVIVYDVHGEAPEELRAYLAPGGLLQ